MKKMKEGFVESGKIKIHYITNNVDEADRLTILFVPGVMMPGWIWENQLDYFSEGYYVVAMDPRSQGESEQATEGHYAYSLAKDIKAVVDKLNLKSFVLVGWSLAVSEVVNFAAHFCSEALIGLVLVDGMAGIDSKVPFYQSTVDFWMQLQTDRPARTRDFIKMIFKHPQPEEYYDRLYESAMRTPTNTVMTLIDNYLLQDFRPLLCRISVPTLIMTVEGPRLEYMNDLRERLPNGKLVVIESAAHALFVDQPERFNEVLKHFIETLKVN